MSGLSAGAICWLSSGCSDSESFIVDGKTKWEYTAVNGLSLIPIMFCPHYDVEEGRVEGFKKTLNEQNLVGLALDNCTAIEIIDDKFRIITSNKGSKARKIKWINNEYIIREIDIITGYEKLDTSINEN